MFRHGAPRTVDLVVGADGLHSAVRRLAFGPEERFRRYLGRYFAGFSEMRGFLQRNQQLAHDGGRVLIPSSRTAIRVRNAAIRLLPLVARTDVLGRGIRRATTSLTLRDY